MCQSRFKGKAKAAVVELCCDRGRDHQAYHLSLVSAKTLHWPMSLRQWNFPRICFAGCSFGLQTMILATRLPKLLVRKSKLIKADVAGTHVSILLVVVGRVCQHMSFSCAALLWKPMQSNLAASRKLERPPRRCLQLSPLDRIEKDSLYLNQAERLHGQQNSPDLMKRGIRSAFG